MKAVVFDLFETLITEWGHEKYTTRRMCADLGLPYEAARPFWEAMHERQYRGTLSFGDSLRELSAALGLDVDEARIAHVTEMRRRTKAACFDALHPEILPMLDALRAQGMRLAILSNCSGEEVACIRKSVLAPYFDAIILSHEMGVCKPEAAIYMLTADALGVGCDDCIFVGDGGSRELYGAEAVGMRAYRAMWYLRKMPMPIKAIPEFRCIELPGELPDIIKSEA